MEKNLRQARTLDLKVLTKMSCPCQGPNQLSHPKCLTWSVGKESSQAYTISEQEQRMKRLEKLKRDLERMKNERDELRGILAHYINKDLNKRFNFETTMLEMQHDQVMSELKNIPQQISEALYMCQELTKNNQLYSIRNCHLLTESLHMKSEVKMLWNENRQLLKEQITLEVCSKETRRLCVEASMKIYDKFFQAYPTGMFQHTNQIIFDSDSILNPGNLRNSIFLKFSISCLKP
ncbi:disks large homolog 5-like [Arvicanthis niloticus]|uniref:disks large homolog 5-like n=1 Tax=Arvicanthis niloticus TaxID=61156 RepID=UPI00403D3C8A